MMRFPNHRKRQRRGVASVEFALLAMFLIIPALAALCELSRGIMVREVLSDAARKGCRMGILPARGNSDITTEVTNILSDNQIDSTGTQITILVNGAATDAKTAVSGDKISVQISVPLSKVYWGGQMFLSAPYVQSETFVMMRQG